MPVRSLQFAAAVRARTREYATVDLICEAMNLHEEGDSRLLFAFQEAAEREGLPGPEAVLRYVMRCDRLPPIDK